MLVYDRIMKIDLDRLPKKPEALIEIIRKQADQYAVEISLYKEKIFILDKSRNELSAENEKLKNENFWLNELIAARNLRLFGRSSEKLTHDELQYWLFNEAEIASAPLLPITDNGVQIKAHVRHTRGRKPISDKLPREIVEHKLSDSEKVCVHCEKARPALAPDVHEEVEMEPAKVYVKKHIYEKVGPCDCGESKKAGEPPIVEAAREPRLIPGGIAAPSMLANLITSKFCDGLPFYRQEKILARYGVDYPRETMCKQIIAVARKCQDLIDLMWEDLRAGPVLNLDETRLRVLNEPGRDSPTISWMHVAVGKKDGRPIILFHYHMKRSGDVVAEAIRGFRGYLQTDGLAAYNSVGAQEGIIHVGCFQHARSNFFETKKAGGGASGLADHALGLIGNLFRIEDDLREDRLPENDFVIARRMKAEPVLKQLHEWLVEYYPQVPPRSLLGNAIQYCLKEWEKLIRYLDHPLLTPSNNAAENAIRPFVIGRKNWLFSYSQGGAHASATHYSLVESAKANGLEPFAYTRYVLTVLPNTPKDKLRDLLPYNIVSTPIYIFRFSPMIFSGFLQSQRLRLYRLTNRYSSNACLHSL
jgi:transposase